MTNKSAKSASSPLSGEKGFHKNNIHRNGYDFAGLVRTVPPLGAFVAANAHGNLSIDFANSQAVKALNTALLKHHYGIACWQLPAGALCPPIPGRVDYIHYVADLLGLETPENFMNNTASEIKILDIGIGANGIYSLLASRVYGWKCVGSDIRLDSLANVAAILSKNPDLADRIVLRHQADKNCIFSGVLFPGEVFDVSVCNPPFHASQDEALKSTRSKLFNLARNRDDTLKRNREKSTLNFGGMASELWCNGGERLFLKKMIKESHIYSTQCKWFTSLVSKVENLKPSIKLLGKLGAKEVKTLEMVQGSKITRILVWTFLH